MKSDVVFALEHAAWPALLVDSAGTVYRASEGAMKAFGLPFDRGGTLLNEIWAPENTMLAPEFLARWERSPSVPVPLKLRAKGGATMNCSAHICKFAWNEQQYYLLQLVSESASPAAVEPKTLVPDVAAQKQKLDCALQLARTVALDFNNALTSILGHTSLVLSRIEPDNPWRSSLLEVEKSAARAAEIANDLATFSRQEKESRGQSPGNLNMLLQRTVESLQHNTGSTQISWTLQFERKLLSVRFDEAKLQQAFFKILENAVQAISGAGRISVQSRNVELQEATQDRNIRLNAGIYVCVEIKDTGAGIPPEMLPRIFEPFYTTKKGGGHRGLGLAWVYGILSNHGGGAAVSSEPGSGTSVRVYLPAEQSIVRDNSLAGTDLSGKETILLVDDEDLLLTMGTKVLSTFGYRVITATTGQKALEILDRNDPQIDLVITDLVMPAMSGRELVERIQQTVPGMRILCTSGYAWPSAQVSDQPYLQKPFTAQDLLLKVRQLLGPHSP
jgi:signal transduction histidine kinase/CheY-like chemotaxis protein